MTLTPQQIDILKTISQRFDLSSSCTPLPLICYALDSDNYLKQEEYEVLKDASYRKSTIDSTGLTLYPNWFSAVVLVFIRNFFERSNGKDRWFGNDYPNFKNNFIKGIQKNRPNDLLEMGGGIRPWLLSQCWIIRQDNTSSIISNNRAMYEALIHYDFLRSDYSWQEVENMDISSIVVDYDVEDELITENEYLNYIWKNYKREYLLSLKALVTPRDNCQEAPAWLRAISSISDTIHGAVSWELRKTSDGSFSPALKLDSSMKDCKICQGDLELPASVGVYHLWYLEEYGFDLSCTKDNPIVITKNKQLIAEVDSPFVLGKFILFKHRASKKCITRKSTLYGGYFYLFHRQETCAPSVELGNYRLLGENETNISRHLRYECKKYRIPYLPQDQSKSLCIGGEDTQIQVKTTPRIVPCNSSDIKIVGEERTIVVEDDVLRLYAYGLSNVKVNGECCFESEPQTCYYEIKPQLKIANQARALENLEAITYGTYLVTAQERNGTRHSLKVVFLPKNWRRFCRKDDLYKSYKAAETKKEYLLYTAPDGETHHLLFPMQIPMCFWLGNNEYLETLDEDQYASMMYIPHIFSVGPKIRVKLRYVDTDEEIFEQFVSGVDDFMNNLFKACYEKINKRRQIEVSIGSQVVYHGKFRPLFCHIERKKGRLYLYAPADMRNNESSILEIRSDRYYCVERREERRKCYRRFNFSQFSWSDDGLTDISDISKELEGNIIQYIYNENDEWDFIDEIIENIPAQLDINCDVQDSIQRIEYIKDFRNSLIRLYLLLGKYNIKLKSFDSIYNDGAIKEKIKEIRKHRLTNSYVRFYASADDDCLYDVNEESDCDWWKNQVDNNTVLWLVARMSKWTAQCICEQDMHEMLNGAFSGDGVYVLWGKLKPYFDNKVTEIWEESQQQGKVGVCMLLILAAILNIGSKGRKLLTKKEKLGVSFVFSIFNNGYRTAVERMCVFMQLTNSSPFEKCVEDIIRGFEIEDCEGHYMPRLERLPVNNWRGLMNKFVQYLKESTPSSKLLWLFYDRLSASVSDKLKSANSIVVGALCYFVMKYHNRVSACLAKRDFDNIRTACRNRFEPEKRYEKCYKSLEDVLKKNLKSSGLAEPI